LLREAVEPSAWEGGEKSLVHGEIRQEWALSGGSSAAKLKTIQGVGQEEKRMIPWGLVEGSGKQNEKIGEPWGNGIRLNKVRKKKGKTALAWGGGMGQEWKTKAIRVPRAVMIRKNRFRKKKARVHGGD